MGYTVFAEFGSPEESQRMLTFMNRHMQFANNLFPEIFGPDDQGFRLNIDNGLSITDHIIARNQYGYKDRPSWRHLNKAYPRLCTLHL